MPPAAPRPDTACPAARCGLSPAPTTWAPAVSLGPGGLGPAALRALAHLPQWAHFCHHSGDIGIALADPSVCFPLRSVTLTLCPLTIATCSSAQPWSPLLPPPGDSSLWSRYLLLLLSSCLVPFPSCFSSRPPPPRSLGVPWTRCFLLCTREGLHVSPSRTDRVWPCRFWSQVTGSCPPSRPL